MSSVSRISRMYAYLEQMVGHAEKGEHSEVMRLNQAYEGLIPRSIYRTMDKKLAEDYDNCRTSCVMAGVWTNLRGKFLPDARERFDRIPKPKN